MAQQDGAACRLIASANLGSGADEWHRETLFLNFLPSSYFPISGFASVFHRISLDFLWFRGCFTFRSLTHSLRERTKHKFCAGFMPRYEHRVSAVGRAY
jgi:hypothetical protein